jgi:glutamate-1-semialdehyde 2,1-aminomutase
MPEPGYLQGAKELCGRYGALLMFDEVITGYRVALGGAQELFNVVPDVAVYAKALAGGYPLAMLIGREDAMQPIASHAVDHGGTYNSNTISMSALEASLEHIMADSEAFYNDLNAKGQRLMEGLKDASKRAGSNLVVLGPGPFFITSFSDNTGSRNYREHQQACDNAKHVRFTHSLL